MNEISDLLIESKLDSKEWQRCVTCGILTEKISGCNYIKCEARINNSIICNSEWCWLCHKLKGNEENKCIWNHPEHNSH